MQISDCRGPGVGRKRWTSKGCEWTFWSDGNILYLDCGDDYILYTLKTNKQKSPQRQHLKWVGLIKGKLMSL